MQTQLNDPEERRTVAPSERERSIDDLEMIGPKYVLRELFGRYVVIVIVLAK